jgi:integrase
VGTDFVPKDLLNAIEFPKLRKTAGRYADGGGLYLEVDGSGNAAWLVRMQHEGRRRDFGLGSLDKVRLADARQLRDKVRAQFRAGLDPVAERKKTAGVPTFREAAVAVHSAHADAKPDKNGKKPWSNGKHNTQWIRTLETYAFPTIGDLPVNKVGKTEVLAVLEPIWVKMPETASRVQQRIASVLNWACAKDYREVGAPLLAVLKHGLPKFERQRGHFEAMPYADVPAFVERLRKRDGLGALALEVGILTATRGGELRGATWDEIDFEAALWSIPGPRMKMKRPHVIPLPPAAIAVFKRALALRTDDGGRLVFPGLRLSKTSLSAPLKPMSEATMNAVLRRMGETVHPHGFRSSFKDWCGEVAGFPNELSEAALSHAIKGKTEAAYRRGTLLERRRAMMAAWADHVNGGTCKVVRLVAQ